MVFPDGELSICWQARPSALRSSILLGTHLIKQSNQSGASFTPVQNSNHSELTHHVLVYPMLAKWGDCWTHLAKAYGIKIHDIGFGQLLEIGILWVLSSMMRGGYFMSELTWACLSQNPQPYVSYGFDPCLQWSYGLRQGCSRTILRMPQIQPQQNYMMSKKNYVWISYRNPIRRLLRTFSKTPSAFHKLHKFKVKKSTCQLHHHDQAGH